MDALEIISRGGTFLVPIAVASILGLALFIDRLLYLRRERIVPARFMRHARALAEERDLEGLRELCQQTDAPASRIVARGLVNASGRREFMRESMEDGGRAELRRMRRHTGAIAAIATVSPLLGLLGTVVGMITTFQSVVASASEGAGSVDVGQLADGIWQALITTAAGLLVAIPVLLAHRYLGGRIDRLIGEIEDLGGFIVDQLTGTPAAEAEE